MLLLDQLGAQLVSLGLGGGGDGGLQRPFALGWATHHAIEGERVVGMGVKLNDLPLVLAELVEIGFQQGR